MSEVRILSPRPARPGRMAPDRYRQTKTLADQRSRTNGMKARIYQPTKTAMQSGKALTRQWRLDYDTAGSRFVEPLMGWTGANGTMSQLALSFDSRAEAEAYARKHGIDRKSNRLNSSH